MGGNGYNAGLATRSGGFLTTGVVIMIFTLRSNQARVERAEKAGYAKAVAEAEKRTKAAVAAAEAAEERAKAAVAALQLAWESWNERRLAAVREGRPFGEPPPGTASGMNGGGRMSDDGGSA